MYLLHNRCCLYISIFHIPCLLSMTGAICCFFLSCCVFCMGYARMACVSGASLFVTHHSIAAHTSFRLWLCIIPLQPIPHSVSGCASFHRDPYLIPSQGMYSVMSQSILTALWRFLPFFMRFRSIWYPTNSSCEPLPMLMPLV